MVQLYFSPKEGKKEERKEGLKERGKEDRKKAVTEGSQAEGRKEICNCH